MTERTVPELASALRIQINREQAIAQTAAERRARLIVARTCLVVRQVLPKAARLVFDCTENDGGWVTTIQAVLDPDNRMLWYGDLARNSPAAAKLDAAGGNPFGYFDDPASDAIDEFIAIDSSDVEYSFAEEIPEYVEQQICRLVPVNLRWIDVDEALAWARRLLDSPDAVAIDASGRPVRAEPALGELRTLLKDWAEYNDGAIVDLVGEILRHYGFWDDDDWLAAEQRRDRFYGDNPDPDTLAYDGSNQPAKRDLTARERDILTRVLGDILHGWQRDDVRARLQRSIGVYPGNLEVFRTIKFVLDPRND